MVFCKEKRLVLNLKKSRSTIQMYINNMSKDGKNEKYNTLLYRKSGEVFNAA